MSGKKSYTISPLKKSYVQLRSIYLGSEAIENNEISPGTVYVSIKDDDEFYVEGTINQQGYLTGMTKLYKRLKLTEGSTITFSVLDNESIVVESSENKKTQTEEFSSEEKQTVFDKNSFKYIHIETFRPENLKIWKPETETDVYLAFGVLQEYTDYQYCCGASSSLLKRLGANYDESSKPDAILIDRITNQYLMAEWKKFSSEFKTNHKPDDVDVLVCWEDNELDKSKLPQKIVELKLTAKNFVETMFKEES